MRASWGRSAPIRHSGGLQYPFDLGVLERQRRSLRHLRRLEHHCLIGSIQPESWQNLRNPRRYSKRFTADRAEYGQPLRNVRRASTVKLLEAEALPLAERQELALEQFTCRLRIVSRQDAARWRLRNSFHCFFNGRDVGLDDADLTGSFPAMDDAGGALQSRVLSETLTHSPPKEPWTQIPQLQRIQRLPLVGGGSFLRADAGTGSGCLQARGDRRHSKRV